MHIAVRELLRLLDEGYDHPTWHGPNLRAAVARVTPREALWRPGAKRHNIWEVTVHAAYWKYIVRRRLRGEKRGSFVMKGSNWFSSPGRASEKEWRAVLSLLAEEHRKLRSAVATISPASLNRRMKKSKWTAAQSIGGVALHDVYHAGQIQLLKRQMKK
jgi:DinB family protein